MSRTATLAVMILLGAAASAGAQAKPAQPPPKPAQPTPSPSRPSAVNRVYISINGAFQTAAEDFGETVDFVENAENGTFTTDYNVEVRPGAEHLRWRRDLAQHRRRRRRDPVLEVHADRLYRIGTASLLLQSRPTVTGDVGGSEARGARGPHPGASDVHALSEDSGRGLCRPILLLRQAGHRQRLRDHRGLPLRHRHVQPGCDNHG